MIRIATINDAKQLAKVKVDTWKTTYKGMVPEEYLNNLDYEEIAGKFVRFFEENNQSKFIYIYIDDATQEVGGYVWFGSPDEDFEYDSEIYALYVFDKYHKQGIGKQLINFAFGKFRDKGNKNLILWVIKDNLNARKFYEKMGGKLVKEKNKKIGGQDVKECGYEFNIA